MVYKNSLKMGKLPDGWFKRGDVDIDPLVIEEMIINGLVYKKVMDYSRLGKPSTFEISYHKL